MNKKVKELKKENFVVILLVGILLLVIAWPVSEKEDTQMAESGISDTINGTITYRNCRRKGNQSGRTGLGNLCGIFGGYTGRSIIYYGRSR